MRRLDPNDKHPGHGSRIPFDAEWIRDRTEVIGIDPTTRGEARYIFRTFACLLGVLSCYGVEAWAEWAIDDPERPNPLLTLIIPRDRFDIDNAEQQIIEAVREIGAQQNPDAITLGR